jgi:hypothetical protein
MKKLDYDDCENLINQCIKLVKKQDSDFFVLKKLKGCVMGLCYWDWIEIDPRKEFLQTSIHECLHYLNPDWSETMVKYAESRIMNQATHLKLMEFISLLSTKLYKKEKTSKRKTKKRLYKP